LEIFHSFLLLVAVRIRNDIDAQEEFDHRESLMRPEDFPSAPRASAAEELEEELEEELAGASSHKR
jgi:hypothetical protein